MQNRYVGDVGDYLKFGLLRAMCRVNPSMTLGVCWYLTHDETHNLDGKHISYLNQIHRYSCSLAACDPELYNQLKLLVDEGQRKIQRVRYATILPEGTLFFERELARRVSPEGRREWYESAVKQLAQADFVFLDPDNGVRAIATGPLPEKYALCSEIASFLTQGKSVIVYNHADRTRGGVSAQLARQQHLLTTGTGVEPIGALVARRGSVRFFFILPARDHRDIFTLDRLCCHATRWSPHAQYWDGKARCLVMPHQLP